MKYLKKFNDDYRAILFFAALFLLVVTMLVTKKEPIIIDNCTKTNSYKLIYESNGIIINYDVEYTNNVYYISDSKDKYQIIYTKIYKLIDNKYTPINNINDGFDNNYFIIDYLNSYKSDNCVKINDDEICFDNDITIKNSNYVIKVEV